MKNTGLIIGAIGVAGLAFVAFKKYKANSAESADQTSVDNQGKSNDQPEKKTERQGSTPSLLKRKTVQNVGNLKGTPLGTHLSIDVLNDDQMTKMQSVITALRPEEKQVLEYLVLTPDEVRDSPEFEDALAAKLGPKSLTIKGNVLSKLESASNWKKINTGASGGHSTAGKLLDKIAGLFGNKAQENIANLQEDHRERKACRKAAREACGGGLRQRGCRKDFRKKCVAEGGYDEGGEDFASFTSSRLTSEQEDFAFNGHNF